MNNAVFALLVQSNQIIVGLSGGADSIALTHILLSHFGSEKLLAAHMNHGIRGDEGDRDEAFVRNFCEQMHISLVVSHKNIPESASLLHMGLEECGRKFRYEFFQSLAVAPGVVIATAHNADDNAETLILNLLRGSGLHGLCGIPAIRGNILRPILDLTRDEIEAYCSSNNLSYVTDSTNLENDYARNKIRNLVFPLLKQINSAAIQNMNHSAEIITSAVSDIDLYTAALLQKAKLEQGLNADVFRAESDFTIQETMIRYLNFMGVKKLERVHLQKICQAIRNSGRVTLPGEMQLTVKQGILTVKSAEKLVPQILHLQIGAEITFCGKKIILEHKMMDSKLKINNLLFKNCFDCAKINGVLTVGPRMRGEKVILAVRNTRKTLKKLFNEYRIPTDLRNEVAVIRDGVEVVFIEGIGASETYKVTKETTDFVVVKIKQEEK